MRWATRHMATLPGGQILFPVEFEYKHQQLILVKLGSLPNVANQYKLET